MAQLFRTLADHATAAAAASSAALAAAADVESAAQDHIAGAVAGPPATVVEGALTAEQAAQLLNPELLGLLLHASAGDPAMLFSVVSAVSALGLANKQQQQQPGMNCNTPVFEDVDASRGSNNSSSTGLTVASSSYTTGTASSTSSCAAVQASPGAKLLRRQGSRLGPRSVASLDTGFSWLGGSPGESCSPSSPAGSEPLRLQYQRNGSWRSGVLRPAASDPEALRALADQVAWGGGGMCGPQFGAADGIQWLHRGDGFAEGADSGSASSSQERLVLERLHGALSEPLGEVPHSPMERSGWTSQQQKQGLAGWDQKQKQVAPQAVPGQRELAGSLSQQQHSSGVGSSPVRHLKQLTGQVQQLSMSTPTSPQHPYMVQHKQLLQHNSLKRTSQPEYGTQEQQLQQQRQLRTAVSLPAARMGQPQHPYMQNYHQQLQQQKGDEAAGSV